MQTPGPGTVTQLLAEMRRGDPDALDRLFPVVYTALKEVSRRQLRRGQHAELTTTELVHETYLKLVGANPVDWKGRGHFFAVAGRAMRQILVDYARRRLADKRGGGERLITLTDQDGRLQLELEELLAVDEALEQLEELNPRLRKVVELRFFTGLSEREIADVLEVTTRTVERDWYKARLFLHRELYSDAESHDGRFSS